VVPAETYFLMVLFQSQAFECYDVLSVYGSGQWALWLRVSSAGQRYAGAPIDFEDGETHTLAFRWTNRLNFLIDDQVISHPITGLEYQQGSGLWDRPWGSRGSAGATAGAF
jgi:hypothetical protein